MAEELKLKVDLTPPGVTLCRGAFVLLIPEQVETGNTWEDNQSHHSLEFGWWSRNINNILQQQTYHQLNIKETSINILRGTEFHWRRTCLMNMNLIPPSLSLYLQNVHWAVLDTGHYNLHNLQPHWMSLMASACPAVLGPTHTDTLTSSCPLRYKCGHRRPGLRSPHPAQSTDFTR